jgi:8-oxo-dGTP diphosphatase
MPSDTPHVQLGVAAVILDKEHKILLSKRISTHQNGKFSCPGGKVDFGETPIQAIIRESKEETGLDLNDFQPLPLVANCIYPTEGKQFLCIWFVAHLNVSAPKIDFIEKDSTGKPKTHGWNWYSMEEAHNLTLMGTTLQAFEKATLIDRRSREHYELVNETIE